MKTSTLLCMILTASVVAVYAATTGYTTDISYSDFSQTYSSKTNYNTQIYSSTNVLVTLEDDQVFILNNYIDTGSSYTTNNIFTDSDYAYSGSSILRGVRFSGLFNSRYVNFSLLHESAVYDSETFYMDNNQPNLMTFYGPGTVVFFQSLSTAFYGGTYGSPGPIGNIYWRPSNRIRISFRVEDIGTPEESKFSVSLNSVGDRMAVGSKEGTNTLVRVYEYDGTSWMQLGEDVEQ